MIQINLSHQPQSRGSLLGMNFHSTLFVERKIASFLSKKNLHVPAASQYGVALLDVKMEVAVSGYKIASTLLEMSQPSDQYELQVYHLRCGKCEQTFMISCRLYLSHTVRLESQRLNG